MFGVALLKKFLLLMLLLSSSTFTEEVDDLYASLVPIPDQTAASRQQGIIDALGNVLVKLTGNSEVAQLAVVQSALQNANLYVDAISFEALPVKFLIYGNAGYFNTGLRVNFSRSAIDNLIRNSQLSVLPSNRPKLLFWIVRDDIEDGRRFLVGDDGDFPLLEFDNQVIEDLSIVMKNRGIPYLFPILDLEDQIKLSVDEAWGLRSEKIQVASERYSADAWVAIRFYRASTGKIRGAWRYQGIGQSHFDDFSMEPETSFVRPVIDELLDGLVAEYSYIPKQTKTKQVVRISDVQSLDDYKNIREHLIRLELVTSIDLVSIEQDEIHFAISTEGSSDLLHTALIRSGRFRMRDDKLSSNDRSLSFDWILE
jgi:hypothetical protein